MDLFSYDAAQQHEERTAARNASVLFNLRASEQFEGFLRQASTMDEFEARVALTKGAMSDLAEGDAALVTAFVARIAGGAFCDDCRCWKVGPKKMCSCDDNGEGALSDDVSAVGKGEVESSVRTAEDNLGGKGEVSGPSMDKTKWKPNALTGDGNLPEINVDGGAFKSERQDVKDTADYANDAREYGELLDHNTDIGKVDTQPVIHTDTFPDTGQANPVTSGFLTTAQALGAISEFEQA
ncbi:hypothetical protein [Candidatus Solirubrobacter pratensis]|uniref:hypothetical protein n=1 Tax=Candidatus Solirubrobacter pratensis TaxID=1298857 RepID=UPI0004020A76|nr:hypothetical protein [Candidatus Solirubrobacter pratensis]